MTSSINLLGGDLITAEATTAPTESGNDTIHELIIIGSGPAGYTAALYSARAELAPVVFEGIEYGGSLMTTTEVENFPGFRDGIMGPDLMEEMRAQAERFGADLRPELVTKVELEGDIKQVWVDNERYQAKAVILATGSAPRYLGIPGEQELLGRGVSACATCDGFFFKDKPIVVIGGGDSAMEEALFLTKFGESVTIVHRREEFRASPIMLERAQQHEDITIMTNKAVEQVLGENQVTGLQLRDTQTGELSEIPAAAMFVAIGHDPRSEMFRDVVTTDDSGYVFVEHPSTKTNIPGVFAIGDLVDSHYQQAITAAGSGCRGAIDAQNYLAELAN
ncbi:MAG: thioredoxin-disulfide reductase [Corynebacterium sp.]|nr:thioredoxin-disulfide reductase [Corynebacterium sp.]